MTKVVFTNTEGRELYRAEAPFIPHKGEEVALPRCHGGIQGRVKDVHYAMDESGYGTVTTVVYVTLA
jgi:hypothetical protein